MTTLKTYSEIFAGYTFRNKLITSTKENYQVINPKDINSHIKQIDYASLFTISKFSGPKKYFLQDQDILLVARGNTTDAVLYEKKTDNRPTIAAGALIVIRVMPDYLDPGYVAWYLNLSDSQANFKRSQVGTTVQSLPISAVHEFKIPVPPLTKQQIFGKLHVLLQQEAQLSRIRDEKRTLLINEQLKRIL